MEAALAEGSPPLLPAARKADETSTTSSGSDVSDTSESDGEAGEPVPKGYMSRSPPVVGRVPSSPLTMTKNPLLQKKRGKKKKGSRLTTVSTPNIAPPPAQKSTLGSLRKESMLPPREKMRASKSQNFLDGNDQSKQNHRSLAQPIFTKYKADVMQQLTSFQAFSEEELHQSICSMLSQFLFRKRVELKNALLEVDKNQTGRYVRSRSLCILT